MNGPVFSTPCHCTALRQGARHMTQLYDRHLAPAGLKTSQYSVLRKLSRLGPSSINALADTLVMDRTTMGRALRPLERDGLVTIGPGPDGRTRAITLTEAGIARLDEAAPFWERAQAEFEEGFGAAEAEALRMTLTRLVA